MTSRIIAAPFFILMLLLTGCSSPSENVQIQDVWARPADEGSNSAVYLSITGGNSEDALIGATTDIAAKTELHESISKEDGTISMSHVHQVQIPPKTQVNFQPGGLHIMLMMLYRSLIPGDVFEITLEFEKGGERVIHVPVRTP